MDPQTQCFPHEQCIPRGVRGQGNIRIHSQKTGTLSLPHV
jgi:hypothetical protein